MNRFALTALAAAFALTALAPAPAEAGLANKIKKAAKKRAQRALAAAVDAAEQAAADAEAEVELIAGLLGVDLDAAPEDVEAPAGGIEAPAGSIAPPPPYTHTVCAAGCDFATIQDAIDAADDGERIAIDGGTYAENLTIDRNIELVQSGDWKVVVIGDGENPVLTVDAEAEVVVDGLDLTGGGGLAGILNLGTLRMAGVYISDHEAELGAIGNLGELHLHGHSAVSGNRNTGYAAGGLTNLGAARIEHCTFLSNEGHTGGAMANHGTAVIEHTSFTANVGYLGGALATSNGTTTVVDSSFSSNHADSIGGAWSNHNMDGTVTMDGVGYAGNTTGSGNFTVCYDVDQHDDCAQ